MLLTDLREQLSSIINNSNLPIDAVFFVVKDIMVELETIYQQEIEKERIIEQQQKDEEEKSNKDQTK